MRRDASLPLPGAYTNSGGEGTGQKASPFNAVSPGSLVFARIQVQGKMVEVMINTAWFFSQHNGYSFVGADS